MNKFFALKWVGCALVAMLFAACADEKKDVAGGTEAESTIALQIQLADGSPAALSRVRALPVDYMAEGLVSTDWAETDDRGFVKLDVEPGEYSVEVRSNGDSSVQGAVFTKVVDLQEQTPVDSISLGELTVIEGFVAAGQGPSVIRIPGLERFIVPDSAGHFVIDSLPAGKFEIVIESRSNRGTIKLSADAGETVPEVSLGAARGFAVEDFESFSGVSATGKILGDGWWYTLDAEGKNLMPLWNETLTRTYSGNEGCASGGCARIYGEEGVSAKVGTHLGFLLGGYRTDYELPGLDTLMFSARGVGSLHVSLVADSGSIDFDVDLSKVWQGYALPVKSNRKILVNRIDFSVATGDTVYLDDVFLGGVSEEDLLKKSSDVVKDSTVYPDDRWEEHDALLAELIGYAEGTRGGAGSIDPADSLPRTVCHVTTTEDYIIVEDTTNVDSTGAFATVAEIAPGSLRDCAYRDSATWILFEKSGTYNLTAPLRMKSNKTIDGRGRDIRITGMGILTNESSNIIFENIRFTAPAITVADTTSRRAISIHNTTHHIWIDHCTFEESPLVEVDVKRGSHHITISWSRFENADTGILFGLAPDIIDESAQTLTMHHNFFDNMSWSGVFARQGSLHAYNNFFMGMDHFGIECTDSASCYMEKNVFNIPYPVTVYRLFDENGPVDATMGFVNAIENWSAVEGDDLSLLKGSDYKPDYDYVADAPDANLAWNIKEKAGPR